MRRISFSVSFFVAMLDYGILLALVKKDTSSSSLRLVDSSIPNEYSIQFCLSERSPVFVMEKLFRYSLPQLQKWRALADRSLFRMVLGSLVRRTRPI